MGLSMECGDRHDRPREGDRLAGFGHAIRLREIEPIARAMGPSVRGNRRPVLQLAK